MQRKMRAESLLGECNVTPPRSSPHPQQHKLFYHFPRRRSATRCHSSVTVLFVQQDAPSTVPGLCWLCRMPLALVSLGDLLRMRARLRPPARQPASAMRDTRRASFAPAVAACKTAAPAASGERQ